MVFQNCLLKSAGACLLVAMLCLAPFTIQSAAAAPADLGIKGQTVDHAGPLAYFYDLLQALWNNDSAQNEPQVRNFSEASTHYTEGAHDPTLDLGATLDPDGSQAMGESGGASIDPNS